MSSFINKDNKSLDLVFCMDCTGSMGPYISMAKQSIQSIINKITEKAGCNDLLFGLVAYRDHPPQENTYITKIYDFTNNLNTMQTYLDELKANGGGDGPEALTSALYDLNNLNWRTDSTKIIILISDAPPHGLGEINDGFPNGDPNGHDPIVITKELAAKGITIYTVGCEPEINNYKFARAFLISLANLTGGQAIGLSNASSLADVILGSTIEELGITKLLEKVEEETQKVKFNFASCGRSFTDEMVINEVYSNLSNTGIKTPQMKGYTAMRDVSEGIIEGCDSLASAKERLSSGPLPKDRVLKTRSSEVFMTGGKETIRIPERAPLRSFHTRDLSDRVECTPVKYSKYCFDDLLDNTAGFKNFTDDILSNTTVLPEKIEEEKIDVVDDVISMDQVKRLISRNTNKNT